MIHIRFKVDIQYKYIYDKIYKYTIYEQARSQNLFQWEGES